MTNVVLTDIEHQRQIVSVLNTVMEQISDNWDKTYEMAGTVLRTMPLKASQKAAKLSRDHALNALYDADGDRFLRHLDRLAGSIGAERIDNVFLGRYELRQMIRTRQLEHA